MRKHHNSILKAVFITLVLITAACQKNSQTDICEVILTDQNSYFYLDVKNYPAKDSKLPIGVFDSGTGGLTVLEAILAFDKHNNEDHCFTEQGDGIRDFRKESFTYLGDQANMPYGSYSRENNTALLKEHIIKDVHFLLANKYYQSAESKEYQTDKQPVKAIVIACNTATAFGKEDIEKFLARAKLNIKVIGVIGAGVRGAMAEFEKNESGTIGVMATAGTVSSKGYVKTIQALKEKMDFSGEIDVFQQAGVGLAGAIDGSSEYIAESASAPRAEYKGPSELNQEIKIDTSILKRYGFDWTAGKMLFDGDINSPKNIQINSVDNYIYYHLISLLEQLRKSESAKPMKSIILGCTHYPFYIDIFERKLKELYNLQENGAYVYRRFMAEKIVLVDPAQNTAKELYEYLGREKMYSDADSAKSEFYISVPNKFNTNVQLDSAGNFTYEYKYGRKSGNFQQYVRRLPFSRQSILPAVEQRLKDKAGESFKLIRDFNRSNPKTVFLKDIDKLKNE